MLAWFKKINWSQLFLQSWHPYAWIAFVIIGLYFKTLFFGYTYLDDHSLILEHLPFLTNIKNFGEAFFRDAFLSTSPFYYRPLLTISLMMDALIGGDHLFGYHLSNIIIHIINSGLLFFLLLKLRFRRSLSFFFVLLFAVHPALSQAVAWIPGRNDSLLALFVLASFIFFIRFWENKRLINYFWHCLFFVLALLTKETGVFLIFVLAGYFIFFLPRNREERSLRWLTVLGPLVVIFAWFILRQGVLAGGGALLMQDLWQSVWLNFSAFMIFLGKIFLPFNLSVLPTLVDSSLVFGFVVFILMVGGLIFSQKINWKRALPGLLWFLVFLLPTLFLHQPELGVDFHLEHRLYLPMMGIIIFILEFSFIKNISWNKFQVLGAGAVFILFFVLSFNHINNFSDRITFWESAVATSPHSPLAQKNLGAMYYLDGRIEEAEPHYREALKLRDTEKVVHNNLGLIYMNQQKYHQAEEEFHQELALNPYYDLAWYNLGLLYYKMGELDKAEEAWHITLIVNPEHPGAIYSLQALAAEKDNPILDD